MHYALLSTNGQLWFSKRSEHKKGGLVFPECSKFWIPMKIIYCWPPSYIIPINHSQLHLRMARRYAGAYGSQSGGVGGGGGGVSTLSSLQRTSEKNNEYLKGLARYAHRDLAEIFDAAEYKALTGDLVELAEEMATVKNVLDVTNVQCRAELAGESAVTALLILII